MNWHYTIGTERRGPVDEATLRRMIASGAIARDALVWNEILPDWIPVSQIAPPEASPAMEGAASSTPATYRRAFFYLLIVRTLMAGGTYILPGLAMSLGWIFFNLVFFVALVLGWLALSEQRSSKDGRLHACILIPIVLMVITFVMNMALRFAGGLIFSDGLPLWFALYLSFGRLSLAIELGCAVYGLMRLKK